MTERELFKRAVSENFLDKDAIFAHALSSVPVPRPVSGGTHMKKRFSALLIAAVTICLAAGTALAANYLLTAGEAAAELSGSTVARAFEGEGALAVNEARTAGSYRVTFLGVASGAALEESAGAEVDRNKTYSVVGIERADGTPLSENASTEEKFFVSPLIKGLDPTRYNIATMNGSYVEKVIGGVLYRMTECDNVEIFADRGLYLCVQQGSFYNADAYLWDQATGTLTPNPAYKGLNLLFDLPLDGSLADPQKAQAYLDGMWKEPSQEAPQTEEDPLAQTIAAYQDKSAEELIAAGALAEDFSRTLRRDENGDYLGAGDRVPTVLVEQVAGCQTGDRWVYSLGASSAADGVVRAQATIATLNGDGTITLATYFLD